MTEKKRNTPAGPVDWQDLRYFLALARHGSLAATARALRVNHATVSRRVASLEDSLGRLLFERRAEGMVLTAAGRMILDEARPMEEAALALLRRNDLEQAGDPHLSGLVRLTTTRVLADSFLVSRLEDFHRQHPAIDVEVLTGSPLLSLARREADIALRFGEPKDSLLAARRLALVRYALYAAPDWPPRLAAGEPPCFVAFDADSDFIPQAAWLQREFPHQRRAFRSNSWIAQALAARAGFGLALLPAYLADRIGGLVSVPLGRPVPTQELWMLIRPDLKSLPRVRAMADFLVGCFPGSCHQAAANGGVEA